MDTTVQTNFPISAEDRSAFSEFKRTRKEAEVLLTLKKIISDASGRETDRALLKKICDYAKKEHVGGVLVSPVNVSMAKKLLAGSGVKVICLVGGNGETLPVVKKYEAKRAIKLGAEELRLIPCYSALTGGNLAYLKREIKKVRRAVKAFKVTLTLSLEDRSLSEEDISLGTRAALEGGIGGVTLRGEADLLLRAADEGKGKLTFDCAGVENAEQLRSLVCLGAMRLTSPCTEKLTSELFSSLSEI